MAPRLIELCFQTAGLWEMSVQNRFGLPQNVQSACLCCVRRIWRRAICTPWSLPIPEQGSFDAEVVDTKGNCYVQLRGYRTAAMPNSLDAEAFKSTARRHGVMNLTYSV